MTDKQKKMCSVAGCGRDVYAKGYCNKHYNQVRAHGRVRLDLERGEYGAEKGECSEPTCNEQAIARGLCMSHYQAYRRAKLIEKQVAEHEPSGGGDVDGSVIVETKKRRRRRA